MINACGKARRDAPVSREYPLYCGNIYRYIYIHIRVKAIPISAIQCYVCFILRICIWMRHFFWGRF